MRAAVRRLRGLVDRYRIDRRLPPIVHELYADVLRARRRDVAARWASEARPTLGVGDVDAVARLHDRRVVTAGILPDSFDAVALATARQVVDALQAQLDTYVVDRDRDRIVLGIDHADRRRALTALATLQDAGWYLAWTDRERSGLVTLDGARSNRRVGRARAWNVFRAYRLGERAVGPEMGVEITFWTPGSSGQLELVGTRGQERFDPRCPHTGVRLGGHRFPGRSTFPVDRSLERFDGPVDVVYTWVDGSDPQWQGELRATAAACGRAVDDAALDPARFRSRDELRYSLRSVWMYCGWVRRIFLVTAGQRPTWLVDHPRLAVVDHRHILPPDGLPTFNSHAIEASLHHIDGLAEHFVYFNDDVFATRPLRPETFFHPNGLPLVFQSDARVPGVEHDMTQAVDRAAIRGRELLEQRFGRVMATKPHHSPHPLLRSVMHEVETEFSEIVGATRRSRFRSPADLSTAASFVQHYAFATRRAVLGDLATEYVHVESGRLGWHLDRIRLTGTIDTCCINETGVGRRPDARREREIADFLTGLYPVAAPWESDARA